MIKQKYNHCIWILIFSMVCFANLSGQVPPHYNPLYVDLPNVTWNNHLPVGYCSPIIITGPTTGIFEVSGSTSAVVEAKKGIHLLPGLRAHDFTTGGYLHADINPNMLDVVAIDNNSIPLALGQFEKLELGMALPANIQAQIDQFLITQSGINPYNPDEISIEATFTNQSSGLSKTIFGFYYQEFQPNNNNPPDWTKFPESYPWRIRFAPPEQGQYLVDIKVVTLNQTIQACSIYFNSLPSNNKGYVKVRTNDRYLQYSKTGELFFPIGQNNAWADGLWGGDIGRTGASSDEYQTQMDEIHNLALNGGNYVRLIMSPQSYPLEWDVLGNYYTHMKHAWQMDRLFDQIHNDNVYLDLCLENQNQYIRFNPNFIADTRFYWGQNPYNYNCTTKNMGNLPNVMNPADFWKDQDARKFFKRRLRYIISRWGYSTNIAVVELMSELDDMDETLASGTQVGNSPYYSNSQMRSDALSWHQEMLQYIKNSLNETNHLLSTSFANSQPQNIPDQIFGLPEIDVTSSHEYNTDLNVDLVNRFSDILKNGLAFNSKPCIIGEMGSDPAVELYCTDVSWHNSLWATAFSGGYGAGLNWWGWSGPRSDMYRENNIKALSTFLNNADFYNRFGNQIIHPHESNLDIPGPSVGIETFALTAGSDFGVGWLHNKSSYWHAYYSSYDSTPNINQCVPGVGPTGIFGAQINVGGFNPLERYRVDWFFSNTGQPTGTSPDEMFADLGGNISLNVPGIYSDVAYVISPSPIFTFRPKNNKGDNDSTSLARKGFNDIRISPNPSNGNFVLYLNNDQEKKELAELFIYDCIGNLIYTTKSVSNTFPLDISSSPSGIYYLKVICNEKLTTMKLVNEK